MLLVRAGAHGAVTDLGLGLDLDLGFAGALTFPTNPVPHDEPGPG
ncbi:hypothetical protein [Streptomyces somaliensis]|nr:hypothetical protein [Streptomyces somaliensis]